MSRKQAEPALRAASDLLFERGWSEVRIAAYPDAGPKEPNAMLRAFAPGLPAQDLMITRKGAAFTIRRWDGVATVGKPIVAESAEALARMIAEEPLPEVRK